MWRYGWLMRDDDDVVMFWPCSTGEDSHKPVWNRYGMFEDVCSAECFSSVCGLDKYEWDPELFLKSYYKKDLPEIDEVILVEIEL